MESKPCLFCLETVEKQAIPNPVGCRCNIVAHQACFETWFEQKHQMECPICHTVAIPNPMAVENIRIVYVDMTREQDYHIRYRHHEKAVAFCCCLLIGWGVGISIINSLFVR